MLYLRLVARAVRWRAGASVAVFLVATAAVLAATLGPVYASASGASVLNDRLRQTPETRRDVLVSAQYEPDSNRDTNPEHSVRAVAGVAADSPWFGPATVLHSVTIGLRTTALGETGGRLAAMESGCAHLVLAQGRCPNKPLDAMLSTRSATLAGFHLGDRIPVKTDDRAGGIPLVVHLVGLYRKPPTSSAFWAPWPLFDQHLAEFTGQTPELDSFLVPPGVIAGRQNTPLLQSVIANAPLLLSQVRLADEDGLRSVLNRVADEAEQKSAGGSAAISAGTPLRGVLAKIDHEKHVGSTLITLATEELAALAVIVLGGIVATTAGARGSEVALAKLRGRRTLSVAAQALFEPVALIVLAAPAGAALAWLTVRAAAGQVLSRGTPIVFPATAYLLAAAAAAAAIVVAALAARRMLVAPVADLLRRGTEAGNERSAGVLITDVAIVALAVAGLIQLSVGGVLNGGRPNPLAALAPTLLAAGVAVLGLRLLPYGLRLVARRTARRRGLVTFLAVRQISRRPRSTRMALLVAVATALAVVAVATWAMAARNRQYRALNEVGAHTVLTVTPNPGVDLLAAVRRADPSGSQAMAAEMLPVSNTQLLAVDAPRLAGIAAWRPGYADKSLPQIATLLTPPLAGPVVLRGTSLDAQLRLTAPAHGAVNVTLGLSRTDHFATSVTIGPVRPGRTSYRAALPFGCTTGCRVTGLSLQRAPGSGGGPLRLHLGGFATDGRSDGLAQLRRPRFWQSLDNSGLSTAGGLDLVSPAPDANGSWGHLATADLPAALPGAVAPVTASVYPGPAVHAVSTTNVDGSSVTVNGVVTTRALPRLDRAGVLVDLTLAERAMTGPESVGVQHQVWLSGSAPPDIVTRLQAQGLHVDARAEASAVRTRLDHTGPALADVAFLIAAVAAAALAVAAAVLGGLLAARRRAYEVAALLAVGLRARTLRRATAVENGVVVGVGLLLGVAAGVGGSVLALRSTPVFVDTNTGPPVESALPVLPVIVVLVALGVALVLSSFLLAVGIGRLATPDRLREAQT